jgi:hypothetical protein
MLGSSYEIGQPLSVLDGVPFAVKDSIDALPYGSSAGTTYVRPCLFLTEHFGHNIKLMPGCRAQHV